MNKESLVKNVNIGRKETILGYEILIQRKGDAFGIFTIIEKAKKKWLWWDEEVSFNLNNKINENMAKESTGRKSRASSLAQETQMLSIVNLLKQWEDSLDWYK